MPDPTRPPTMPIPPPDFGPAIDAAGEFFAFHRFAAPMLVRIVFAAGMFAIPVAAILLSVQGMSPWDHNHAMRIIVALLCCVPAMVLWRLACEAMMILFVIAKLLEDILLTLRRKGSDTP